MISDKMKGFVNGSSAIRAMFEDGKKMAAIYGAENVYDFSLGNPSVEAPEEVKQAAIEVLNSTPPNALHGYPNNLGFEDVRLAIANQSNKQQGTSYTENNIVMTTGAAAALNIVLKCILNPGDEVIVFAPYFGEYKSYVGNYDGVIVAVSPNTKDFQPNLTELNSKITSRTKAVIINTPNNPTGVIYSAKTLSTLGDILKDKQKEIGHPIYLLSDEPYRELFYGDFEIPFVPNFYDNTFICYSYSKSLCLPGERIGHITVNSKLDGFDDMISALSCANRISGFVNAPTLWQKVIPKVLDCSVDVSIYKKNRDTLYNMLTELGYECVKPDGAFYVFPKALINDDKAFCEAAKEFRLLIVPGSAFGCPGYFRMAYCVPHETIVNAKESFRALKEKFSR